VSRSRGRGGNNPQNRGVVVFGNECAADLSQGAGKERMINSETFREKWDFEDRSTPGRTKKGRESSEPKRNTGAKNINLRKARSKNGVTQDIRTIGHLKPVKYKETGRCITLDSVFVALG